MTTTTPRTFTAENGVEISLETETDTRNRLGHDAGAGEFFDARDALAAEYAVVTRRDHSYGDSNHPERDATFTVTFHADRSPVDVDCLYLATAGRWTIAANYFYGSPSDFTAYARALAAISEYLETVIIEGAAA